MLDTLTEPTPAVPPESGPVADDVGTIRCMAGKIYCGDNLEVLSLPEFFHAEMVDLVYADPPFNSQRTYNIVYKDSNAQTEATTAKGALAAANTKIAETATALANEQKAHRTALVNAAF